MPQYYFHWECNKRSTRDCWGVELPDLAAARRWAETETCNLVSVWGIRDLVQGAITIADDSDAPLAQVFARDVFSTLMEGPCGFAFGS